ncbi:branched chain amino acid ABC transporter substrate-binding protein [Nocardioides baekrokdamisoli]|uniref:Branched chain amino acid ABC transporter substrate-binding protein n=1 Tax=Nocardioides baekrokdamisoli TaxID=1804624 RepID=A0A3G9IUD3_9ACTN|nr:branched-chain amino acid ABC transporter substrate-binding protein [Nocardioides baekrokdamisoli]BBH17251.1 branched chain amino acid ABC transporter substrate-binding protein [Nocardioides baekrokdamisoli]
MSRISRSGAVFAAVGATAALALTACGTTNSSTGGGACSVKIGYLGALTGDAGALGQNMLGGINTALAKYNAAHSDCKVSVMSEDSQGDAAQATPLAKTLIDDANVIGVVGPGFSKESAATGGSFSQAGLATVSPSATNVKLTTNGWKTFHRVLANDDAQGPAAAKYLTAAGAKKVFVIDDSEDYGTGLATAVKKALGSSVAGTDSIQQKQTDFAATVTKVKSSGADAVFVGGYYQEAGLIAKQLRQAGWTGKFESGDGSEDPKFIDVAGKAAAEGAILTAAAAPATADFTAAYKAANGGKEPGLYSAEAYDATNVFLDAIAAGKTTRADVLAFVNSYDKPGVTKQIKFTSTGEVTTQTIYAYVVKGGVIQPGKPIE